MSTGGIQKLTQITLGIEDVAVQLAKVKQDLANAAQEINTKDEYKLRLNTSAESVNAVKTQVNAVGTSLKTTTANANQLNQAISGIGQLATTALSPIATQAQNAGKQMGVLTDVFNQLGPAQKVLQSTSDSMNKNLKTGVDTATKSVTSMDGAFTTLHQKITEVDGEVVKTTTNTKVNFASVQKQLNSVISTMTDLSLKASGLNQTTGVQEFSSQIQQLGTYANQLATQLSKGLGNQDSVVAVQAIVNASKQLKVQLTELTKEQTKANAEQNRADTTYKKMLTTIQNTGNQYTALANKITKSSESSEQLTASFNGAKSIASELAQILAKVTQTGTVDANQISRVKELSSGYFTAKENVGLFTSEAKKARQELESQAKQMSIMTTKTTTLKGQMDSLASSMTVSTTKGISSDTLTTQVSQVETYTVALDKAFKRYETGKLTTQQYATIVSDLTQRLSALKLAFNEEVATVAKVNATVSSQKSEVDALVKKYQTLSDTVQSSTSLSKNGTLVTGISQASETLKVFNTQLSSGVPLTQAQQLQLSGLTTQFTSLNTQAKTSTSVIGNFLSTITDKARWLAAFYLIMQIKQAFTATIETIKGTETAVVELQRVLNEDVSSGVVTDELYQLAINYGRSIDEVSDSAVKFAQTGADWADVLTLVESTMLAVNTAELEVEDATTSLIAVLSQFNLDVEDMMQTIDKINITADNFSVTSEKITQALVRSGGTASAYGLELEQTIALITALSEATGRSGENLGTALNSLITFSTKASSIETFAKLGGDVEEAVKSYEMGAASIIDVWTAVSNSVDSLSSQQASVLDELLSSDDYAMFAGELESEASELTATIQDTYSAVGTYRQNYFIGLLGNLKTYQDALANMTDAEGYSLEENAKVMDTLQARSQALTSSLQALAADFGENGALDFLKMLTSFAQGAVDLVGALGGIPTILSAVTTAILLIKQTNIVSLFETAYLKILYLKDALRGGTVATNAFKLSISSVAGALSGLMIVVTLVTTAINAISGIMAEVRQAMMDGISDSLEATRSYQEQADSLKTLTKNYKDAKEAIDGTAEKENALNEVIQTITDSYWLATDARNALNGSYEDGIAVLNALADAEFERWRTDNLTDYKNALDTISEQGATFFSPLLTEGDLDPESVVPKETLDRLEELGVKLERVELPGGETKVENLSVIFESSDAIEQIDLLRNAMDVLYQDYANSGEWTYNSEQLFSAISVEVKRLEKEYAELFSLIDEFEGTEAEHIFNDMAPSIEDVAEEGGSLFAVFTLLEETFKNTTINGEGTKSAVYELAEALYYATTSANETTTATDAVSASFGGLAEQTGYYSTLLDNNYDKMQLVLSAQSELKKTGKLSVATVQDLYKGFNNLDGVLSLTQDGFISTDGALEGLLTSMKEQYILESDANVYATAVSAAESLKISAYASTTDGIRDQIIALKSLAEASMATAQIDAMGLTGVERYAALGEMREASNIISKYDEALGSIDRAVDQAMGASVDWSNLLGNAYQETSDGADDASGSVKNLTEEQEAYIDALEKTIKVKEQELDLEENRGSPYENQVGILKELQGEQHKLAEYYRSLDADLFAEEINEASLAWWDYQKQIDALTKTNLEEWQDTINAQIKENVELLKGQKDSVNDYYDNLVESLEEVEAENDRLIAQQEYYDSLDDAKSSLAEASARSGVEYREEEANIMEEINDLQADWQQQLDEWELEDQIAALERARDNEIKALEALIEIIENASDLVVDVDVSSSASAEDVLQELEEKYGVPLGQYSETLANEIESLQIKALENVATEAPEIYNENMLVPLSQDLGKLFGEDMNVLAIDSASIFLTAWQEGFINPVKNDLDGILSDFSLQAIKAITTLTVAQASAMAQVAQATASAVNTTNNYNNQNTSNSVVNLTQTSSANATSLLNSITTLP